MRQSMNASFYLHRNTRILGGDCFLEKTGIPACVYAVKAVEKDLAACFLPETGAAREAPPSSVIQLRLQEGLSPEAYEITFPDPETMEIRAGDDLGAVYGLYRVSEEMLGVHPMDPWLEIRRTPRVSAAVSRETRRSGKSRIRYRGWFVNDEVLLESWRNPEKWQLVFETILRCGGNLVIPGTDKNSDLNRQLAWDMGLWVSHHHAEPLGAEMFARAYPGEQASYSRAPERFEALWTEAILSQKDHKVIWNLGFRGQGDRPFWEDDPDCNTPEQRGALMSRAIARQAALVAQHVKTPVCCTNLYGEVLELYRGGFLTLPDGLIKIWADNGYGRMVSRRQGNDNPRYPALPLPSETGPHGMYYHVSFHDLQASNHLTMSPNSLDFLAKELEAAVSAGADDYWIVNCGSVKPHLCQLSMVRDLWHRETDPQASLADYTRRCYPAYPTEMAAFFRQYSRCTAVYGPHKDDRAGEQFWYHPVRELIGTWLAGEQTLPAQSLRWLGDADSLAGQAALLRAAARRSEEDWHVLWTQSLRFFETLSPTEGERFNQSFLLQVRLQYQGLLGTKALCDSFEAAQGGDLPRAFVRAGDAVAQYRQAVTALEEASTGYWQGYYDYDSLTDIRLTLHFTTVLFEYLRILGDVRPFRFNEWERRYVQSQGDGGVALLSAVSRPLDSEALYQKMKTVED